MIVRKLSSLVWQCRLMTCWKLFLSTWHLHVVSLCMKEGIDANYPNNGKSFLPIWLGPQKNCSQVHIFFLFRELCASKQHGSSDDCECSPVEGAGVGRRGENTAVIMMATGCRHMQNMAAEFFLLTRFLCSPRIGSERGTWPTSAHDGNMRINHVKNT